MNDRPVKILLVEDNQGDACLIQEMLKDAPGGPFELECADRLSGGMERLATGEFDALLLDLGLPDSQGLETLGEVRTQAPALPIVVLTGLDDEVMGIEAVRRGAEDYLVKGQVDANLLARALQYSIERTRLQAVLRESEQRFRQAQRMEAVGHLAGGIAHDFNNLLTGITGYAQLAIQQLPDESPAGADLRSVIEVADRATRLTQQREEQRGVERRSRAELGPEVLLENGEDRPNRAQ